MTDKSKAILEPFSQCNWVTLEVLVNPDSIGPNKAYRK